MYGKPANISLSLMKVAAVHVSCCIVMSLKESQPKLFSVFINSLCDICKHFFEGSRTLSTHFTCSNVSVNSTDDVSVANPSHLV